MRRLPNTYPGDVTKYPTGRGTIGIGAPDAGSKVLFYNETPVNLDLDFYNGNTDVLHAWEANFWTLDGEVGDITWAIDTDSLAVVNPPINAVFTTLLNPEEKLNDKAYPMPLIRQIGGQQAIVSSASQTINDGNALQQVVEATLQGHSSSDVIINNDGSFTLKGAGLLAAVGILTHILGNLTVDGASTFTGELTASSDVKTNTIRDNINGNVAIDLSAGTGGMSLAKVAVLTHILGTLTVDQTALISGVLTAVSTIINTINSQAATNLVMNVPTGQKAQHQVNAANVGFFDVNGLGIGDTKKISSRAAGDIVDDTSNTNRFYNAATGQVHTFQVNGANIIDVKPAGIGLYSGTKLGLLTGSISAINTGTVSIGASAAVVVNHGMAGISAALLTTNQATSSGTNSAYSYTSTQFTAYNGAAATLVFRWVAYNA